MALCFAACKVHPSPAPSTLWHPPSQPLAAPRVPGDVPGDAAGGVCPHRGSTHPVSQHRAQPQRLHNAAPLPAQANKPAGAEPCPAQPQQDLKQTTKPTGLKTKQHVQQRLLNPGTAKKPQRHSRSHFGHPSPAAPAPQPQPRSWTRVPGLRPSPMAWGCVQPSGRGISVRLRAGGCFPAALMPVSRCYPGTRLLRACVRGMCM